MSSVELPRRLLSLGDWEALPADSSAQYELQEGVLIVTPRPLPSHARAVLRIARALDEQLPAGLEVLLEVDVYLERGFPPTVRAPDVAITRTIEGERKAEFTDVLVAVEVLSPGSVRTDTVLKPVEYANAGIGHYWVVDLGPPVTLTAHRRAGDGGYQQGPPVTGTFTTAEPVPLRLPLEGLAAPR